LKRCYQDNKVNKISVEKNTMQTKKKIISLVILLVQIFLLPGCSSTQKPADIVVDSAAVERHQNDSIAKRFQEPDPEGPTVVESAMKLSGEYSRLSQEAALLQQQNENLIAKNRQLNEQVVSLGDQLQQTQKELAEANSLLIEMRVELNNWKADILGFREEMRNAETAQLETLLRILKVLGGQVGTESAKAEVTGAVGSAVASASKPDQP
jgi:DNA repair exonuclease SbcCD ATPase subunit